MKSNSIIERAKKLLSLKEYATATQSSPHLLSFKPNIDLTQAAPADQYILRMLIKSPQTDGFVIPPELHWAKPLVEQCFEHHRNHFPEQFFGT